jgi:predicted DNA-binding transcriptional regulator AlpA
MQKSDMPAVVPAPTSSTVAEVAARHSISRGTIYKMIAAGTGPRLTKFGRRSVIQSCDEAAWLASLREAVS